MKGGTVGVALILLCVSAMPQGAYATPPTTRGAVLIGSDAAFTAANGVIGGAGTPADPYVIANWRFSATSGTAVVIQDTTASVLLRDNIFDGNVGLIVRNNTGEITVRHNQFLVRAQGIVATGVDVEIGDNSFIRVGLGTQGIVASSSLTLISNNSFTRVLKAVVILDGNATIVGNDIHDGDLGIHVKAAFETCAIGNVITDTEHGILYDSTIKGCVNGNLILSGDIGITLYHCKDIEVANNTIRGETKVGAIFESSSGNFTGNVVFDGRLDGLQVWRGPILAANNTISNNLGIGMWFSYAVSVAENNTVTTNGLGILLAAYSTVTLTSNTLANNRIGIDLRYDSRQSITHMSGNVVNGVNVDGTIDATQRVYYYQAANVAISGGVRDSGFSAGYFGSLTAQGNVVLWEVDNAIIDGTVISHATIGVNVYHGFNVVIANATLLQNGIGVYAQGTTSASGGYGGGSPPPCVVSIKDTNITIPVDPPATIGVDAHACLVNVLRTNISVVDTGIRFDASSQGEISGNTIYGTKLGLDIATRYYVKVEGNVLAGNTVGARFTTTNAYFEYNHVHSNRLAGVELTGGSWLLLEENLVEGNGEGIVDLRPCSGGPTATCSSVESEENVFLGNRGDGIRVNGTSTFEGDVFSQNGRTGARLGSATMAEVTATENGEDGISARGTLVMRDSTSTNNLRHGLRIVGSAEVRDSNFSANAAAGVRASLTTATFLRVNASDNQDGILMDELPLGLDTSYIAPTALLGPTSVADPLHVHLSVLIGNDRDAIRSTAGLVNATHNWFGGGAPAISIADQVGAFRNGVSPTVRFVPWFEDRAMTTTGPFQAL